MTRILFPIALVLACLSASAEEIAVLLPDQPKSYIVSVDAAGVVTIVPLKSMTRPGPAPNPPPPPDPSPVLTDRAKAIRDAAMKVTGDSDRTTTAKGLALLYREIAKLARDGTAKDVPSLVTAVRDGTNRFLATRPAGVPAAWQPVRDLFGTQWTTLTAGNKPLADYAVLLDECAAGLDASAPQRSLDPAIIQLIMQIIQLIISLLKPVP